MDRTKRLLLLVAASCIVGHESRMSFAQATDEPPALAAQVMVKMTGIKEDNALSVDDLRRMPEFANQDVAQIQAALDYLRHAGKLVPDSGPNYYDPRTEHG